jgi:hypothetical protein
VERLHNPKKKILHLGNGKPWDTADMPAGNRVCIAFTGVITVLELMRLLSASETMDCQASAGDVDAAWTARRSSSGDATALNASRVPPLPVTVRSP